MKGFFKLLFVFIFTFFIIDICSVCAFETEEETNTCSGSYTTGFGTRTNCVIEDTNGNKYFCLEIEKNLSGGTDHNLIETVEGRDQACGVLAAYDSNYISAPNEGTNYYTSMSSTNFYSIQKKIWDYQGYNGNCSRVTTTTLNTGNISVSSDNIEMIEETIAGKKYYTAQISVTTSNLNNNAYSIYTNLPTGSIVSTTKNGSNINYSTSNSIYVRIPIESVTSTSNFDITLQGAYDSARTETIVPFIEKYKSTADYVGHPRQKLGKIGLKKNTSVSEGYATKLINFSIAIPSNYGLKIIKQNQEGKPISGVKFTLKVDDVEYEETTNANGIAVFEEIPELSDGETYRLTEFIKPGYEVDKTNLYYKAYENKGWDETGNKKYREKDGAGSNYVYWDINTFGSNRELLVINEKNCVSEFNALSDKNNLNERIRLYEEYGINTLLNLNETNATKACTATPFNQSL